MHLGVHWPLPSLTWPDGRLVCCTFRVAYEAFRKSGRFKQTSKLPINLASLSHANYGGAVGIWRLREIFRRNGIKATIGANGLAVEKWPETITALYEDGHEISAHGMTNDYLMTDLTPEEQRKDVRSCVQVIKDCIGIPPVGWAGPANLLPKETVAIVAEEGFTWFGDVFDDDLPYVATVGGKRICMIPKLNYANDWRAWNEGFGNGQVFFQEFKDAFDFVYDEALRGRPGMMDVVVHAELGGRPDLALGLEQMMRYVAQFRGEIWQVPRREIAEYVLRTSKRSEEFQPMD